MTTDPDITALHNLIRRATNAETTLHHIRQAWQQLPHTAKMDLGRRYPQLTDTLIQAEDTK